MAGFYGRPHAPQGRRPASRGDEQTARRRRHVSPLRFRKDIPSPAPALRPSPGRGSSRAAGLDEGHRLAPRRGGRRARAIREGRAEGPAGHGHARVVRPARDGARPRRAEARRTFKLAAGDCARAARGPVALHARGHGAERAQDSRGRLSGAKRQGARRAANPAPEALALCNHEPPNTDSLEACGRPRRPYVNGGGG